MPPDQRPPFPTYLLPSFAFPFRRRPSSTASVSTEQSIPSLSSSPVSSAATTPSSSPSTPHFLPASPITKSLKGLLHAALQNESRGKPLPQRERLSAVLPSTLKCGACATDIAFASQIVSKGFTGRHGRAYLVAPPPRDPYSGTSANKKPAKNELVNTRIGKSVNRELLTGAHVVADVSCLICGTVLGWKYVDAKEPGQRYKIGKFILETKRVVVGVCWEDGVGDPEGDEERYNREVNDGDDGVIVFDSEDEDECEDLFAGVWDPELVAKRRSKRVNTRKKADSNV